MLKSKTLSKQIGSALLIAIIPLLTLVFVTSMMLSRIAQRENEMYALIQSEIRILFEKATAAAFQSSYYLAADREITQYAQSRSQSLWEERRLAEKLAEQTARSEYIELISVYFAPYRRIVSSATNHDADMFFRLYPEFGQHAFMQLLENPRGYQCVLDESSMYFSAGIFGENGGKSFCVTQLNLSALLSDLRAILPRESDQFAIFYGDQAVISSSPRAAAVSPAGNGRDRIASLIDMDLGAVVDETPLKGRFSLLFIRQQTSPLDLLRATPALLILLACFGVTLLLCFVTGYYNYKPVRNIYEMVREKASGSAPQPEKSEFRAIESSIRSWSSQIEQLTKKVEQQNEVFRAFYLERIITNQSPIIPGMEDIFSFFDMSFIGRENFVLLTACASGNGDSTENADYALLCAFRALVTPRERVYKLRLAQQCVFIFSVNAMTQTRDAAIGCIARIEAQYGCRFAFAASSAVDRAEALPAAYQEAFSMLTGSSGESRPGPQPEGSGKAAKYAEASIEFIHQNYADLDLNVEKIAAFCGIDNSYLTKIFKKETGMGLLEYLQRYRIKIAKKLLRQQQDVLINKLCLDIGYQNVATFIRVFKKYEGITPGQYREMALENADQP